MSNARFKVLFEQASGIGEPLPDKEGRRLAIRITATNDAVVVMPVRDSRLVLLGVFCVIRDST
ncbi:MAG: hypothetical protein MUE50_01895 [Pirellulaceae bacterium]|nr:hypothetical protein [Pirellulaceae bacterium]